MSERSWRWIWRPGLGQGVEEFTFRSSSAICEARGKVEATLEGVAINASYLVEADAAWRTRRVRVDLEGAGLLEIFSGGEGDWSRADGKAIPELDGCLDPDISMTPFTNTLPIRRLDLKVGQSADIEVAYVLVPELTLRAAPQRYTHIEERLWRFESLDSGFAADITVDAEGFIVDYPGLFRRG
jgi:hypothetical protein